MENKENEFNFDNDLQKGNNIIDLHERLLFFKKRLKEFNQTSILDWDNIRDKYSEEIKFINDEISIKTNRLQIEFKTPETLDFHKPKLTQQQISMLFIVLKDKNVFRNNIEMQHFYNIISDLTGYSAKQYKKKISTSKIIEISDKENDYLVIIDKLKEITKVFEDKLKEIKNR